MNRADWIVAGFILALFLVSSLLAMAETAFVRMNRIKALSLEEDGRKGAARLVSMLEHPEKTLNAVLLVLLICQLTTATLVGVLFGELVGPIGLLIGTTLEVAVFFVFAEVAPKTYAIQNTERAALGLTWLLSFLTSFPPLRLVSSGLIGVANVVLPGRGLKEGPYVSEKEIRTMADVAADEESIEREERRLIHSIFEFGDTVVREVMLPRPDMKAIQGDETIDTAIRLAIEGGFSRFPVYEESTDNILGLVHLKDLVKRSAAGEAERMVRVAVRPAVFVPEQKRVAELLREMQTQHFHMAIVVDEYGGTSGLVTLEDLLEEIVGEISDEYDADEPGLEWLEDGGLRVPGGTHIDAVSEALAYELPDAEWDTVGGLVLNLLGHLPVEGETVTFQGLEFRTERVQGRRVLSVSIHAVPGGGRSVSEQAGATNGHSGSGAT